ncbi:hypothetical protein CMV_026475 [Castanea mollissima]|uniref:Uncharacterized protein n=1 Tax=Castanea mollissima TaxID=60419 RepID=A0A8J4Q7U8_9ROSI|nr:hypothetical protein CMV_026475 [Castanea mollissima]
MLVHRNPPRQYAETHHAGMSKPTPIHEQAQPQAITTLIHKQALRSTESHFDPRGWSTIHNPATEWRAEEQEKEE